MKTETLIGGVVVLLLLGVVAYFFLYDANEYSATQTPSATDVTTDGNIVDDTRDTTSTDDSATADSMDDMQPAKEVIGQSKNGNDITAYHFGTGKKEILLVAGVHGAYAANTSELAHELRSYLDTASIPESLKVTVIPLLNPDGLDAVYGVTDVVDVAGKTTFTALGDHNQTIPGRFNADNVDLNRNFDCDWAATSMWRSQEVSGGNAAFSEPEAKALRDYVLKSDPVAAIVWFSAEGKVYPSACDGSPSSASETLTKVFAEASGYPSEEQFDAYAINGDMVNWFAKQGIPAISVLLSNYTGTEFSKNRAGLQAVLSYYAQ